jgi:prolyl-tRNA editing enzyme YbaK/EbsC (Cys-tRNA(Pro) deacylase)
VHPTAAKVARRLNEHGLDVEVLELSESTRTAADAAEAVESKVGQIVKSLVFVAGDEPILCLCAGDRRVDIAALGPGVRRASAAEVRAATGFAIGGVPPLGHDRRLRTVVDPSLRRFRTVWCAAGTPNAVFAVDVELLIQALGDPDVRDAPFGPSRG